LNIYTYLLLSPSQDIAETENRLNEHFKDSLMASYDFADGTARSSTRAREVMLRKIVGASRSRLIVQFLTESVITSLVSFFLAITIVQVLLPKFNQLALVDLDMARLYQARMLLASVAMVVLLGIIAGIYPALSLSGFQAFPTKKSKRLMSEKSVLPRRILLTIQYIVSIVLIISVLSMLKQLRYMKSADLGFNKELH
jgi:putative ABC transport system permease protein